MQMIDSQYDGFTDKNIVMLALLTVMLNDYNATCVDWYFTHVKIYNWDILSCTLWCRWNVLTQYVAKFLLPSVFENQESI